MVRFLVGVDLELLDVCCEEFGSEELEIGIDECFYDYDEFEIGVFDFNCDDGDYCCDIYFVVRLGFFDVFGINIEMVIWIVEERECEFFVSFDDFVCWVDLSGEEVEVFVLVGVFDDFVGFRCGVLW